MILNIMDSNNKTYNVIIDEEDYNCIKQYSWHINKGYVEATVWIGNNKKTTIRLHRLIMNCPKDKEIDHTNRNKLDNRKSNLIICDRYKNCQNRYFDNGISKYKGVYKKGDRWETQIQYNDIKYYIGLFFTEDMAALMVNNKYLELNKDFQALNFIDKEEMEIRKNEDILQKEYFKKIKKNSKYKNVKLIKNGKWIGRKIINGKEYTTKQYCLEIEAFNAINEKINKLQGGTSV